MQPNDQNNQGNSRLSDIASKLKDANNVLITVSANPSVDQLSACIGLTLALNKKDKHATAVFSGEVPSVIEFLEPEKTLEKNTDSLRDFIISLDKSKADKLRYKVEDEVVKIFITPYKTSISDKDLNFSQGDFNVDAVVAIGVYNKNELDNAIISHGRILHDATVMSLNLKDGAELGSMHWLNRDASSLSEMTADLVSEIDDKILDSQIATAFLTGIVAETDRFRNEKSAPHTMSVAGNLMSAGASTQLVSSKLEPPKAPEKPAEPKQENNQASEEPQKVSEELPEVSKPEPPKPDDGAIEIDHSDDIHIDETGKLKSIDQLAEEQKAKEQPEASSPEPVDNGVSLPETQDDSSDQESPRVNKGSSMISEPPAFGGQLTANTEKVDQQYVSAPDPLAPQQSINRKSTLSHDVTPQQTLTDLEKSVNSPHVDAPSTQAQGSPSNQDDVQLADVPPPPPPDQAREAIDRAVQSTSDYPPKAQASVGSSPLGYIDHDRPQNSPDQSSQTPPPPVPPPIG